MNTTYTNESKKFNNMLFPIYKMLSWDLLFYYAISFLFLTQIKGISASQVLLVDSFYTIFKFVLHVPSTFIIEKIGKRNSLILGNGFIFLYVLFQITALNYSHIILANFFGAFGFVLKGICESSILYDSIPSNKNKSDFFAKLDAKGSAGYYIIDAISCVITGFTYSINPYLPMVLCLFFTSISMFLAYRFKSSNSHLQTSDESKLSGLSFSQRIIKYLNRLKTSSKLILKSNRLKSLLLIYGVFSAFLTMIGTFRRSLLVALDVSPNITGIVFAILGIIAGISVSKQKIFHKKFKNRALSYIIFPTIISFIVAGFIVILGLPHTISVVLIIIVFSIQFITKGPFYTLSKRYLGNFSTSSARLRIFTVTDLIDSISKAIVMFVASCLLNVFSTAIATIILGFAFLIIFVLILKYTKTRVGLKPEEYKKEDIDLLEIS